MLLAWGKSRDGAGDFQAPLRQIRAILGSRGFVVVREWRVSAPGCDSQGFVAGDRP